MFRTNWFVWNYPPFQIFHRFLFFFRTLIGAKFVIKMFAFFCSTSTPMSHWNFTKDFLVPPNPSKKNRIQNDFNFQIHKMGKFNLKTNQIRHQSCFNCFALLLQKILVSCVSFTSCNVNWIQGANYDWLQLWYFL